MIQQLKLFLLGVLLAPLAASAARVKDMTIVEGGRDNQIVGYGLVIGLQGRFAEAEQIASADLPPDQAAANVAYLRKMLARNSDTPKPKPVARAAAGTS